MKSFYIQKVPRYSANTRAGELTIYELVSTDIKEIETGEYVRLEDVQPLIDALKAITMIAGNLPDDRLIDKTGANDAAYRGGMVCNARDIAREALANLNAD